MSAPPPRKPYVRGPRGEADAGWSWARNPTTWGGPSSTATDTAAPESRARGVARMRWWLSRFEPLEEKTKQKEETVKTATTTAIKVLRRLQKVRRHRQDESDSGNKSKRKWEGRNDLFYLVSQNHPTVVRWCLWIDSSGV